MASTASTEDRIQHRVGTPATIRHDRRRERAAEFQALLDAERPVFSEGEVHAMQDRLRGLHGPSRTLTPWSRARYVGMLDGDLARDLALDADEDDRR